MSDIQSLIATMAADARKAAREIAKSSTTVKDDILLKTADRIIGDRKELQEENEKDLFAARDRGLTSAFIDRLKLSDKIIDSMAQGLRDVAALPDPVGEVPKMWKRPNGLQ